MSDDRPGLHTPSVESAKADVAVIILTFNEAPNLPQALASVCGWASQVFVLDSFSTDNTVEIARAAGCRVAQNRFVDYAKQRNYAIENLPVEAGWILFLDADEWLTDELKAEITEVLSGNPAENGFYIKRRMVWMGCWIRRGYYPTWILRLFRRGFGRCEDRPVNEHLIVEGKIGQLRQDFVHEDQKGISDWIIKHDRYAEREALELLKLDQKHAQQEIGAKFFGSQAERKRWLRHKVWNRLPPLLRPWLFFIYRYVLCGGFLDGREAFIYHFLQALWFMSLVDAKYLEAKWNLRRAKRKPDAVDLHDGLAKDWERKYEKPRFQRRAAQFLSLAKGLPLAGQIWLDAGCGTGFLARGLSQRGCKVVGVDASQEMLNAAQTLAAGKQGLLFCRIQTVESLPFADHRVDGMVCSSVIEYLDQPETCLAELSRVLKPGGVLLISAPNRQSLLRRGLKLAYFASGLVSRKPWPEYLSHSRNEYSYDTFWQCLEKSGFEVLSMEYYSPLESSLIPTAWVGSLLVCMARKPIRQGADVACLL